MDLIEGWKQTCEHGTADTVCELCAGALHPVLAATTRHLEQLLTDKQHREIHMPDALRLSIETDDLFEEVKQTLAHLTEVEGTPETPSDKATDELLDVGIIASDVQRLVNRFERVVPNLRDHQIVTGVRSTML